MSEQGRLARAVALVTAGGQGIGEAVSKTYAHEGATVAVVDINEKEANRVAGEIEAAGGKAFALTVDVTDSAKVNAMVDTVVERGGTVDILLNGAGGFHRFSPITEVSDEEWNAVITVNLTTAFYCARACSKVMMDNNHGRIISISSGAGISPNPHAPVLCALWRGQSGVAWHDKAARP